MPTASDARPGPAGTTVPHRRPTPSADPEVDALVRAAVAGDERAFEALVECYRNRVWAVCFRITGDRQDAEDALQDTMIAAWRGVGAFRGEAQFRTWLFRIASNAAIAVSRKHPASDPLDRHERAGVADPAREVAAADHIRDALVRLPEVYRVTVVLRAYGDLSYAEIADHLAVPVQTVRSRLSRARAALQRSLSDIED